MEYDPEKFVDRVWRRRSTHISGNAGFFDTAALSWLNEVMYLANIDPKYFKLLIAEKTEELKNKVLPGIFGLNAKTAYLDGIRSCAAANREYPIPQDAKKIEETGMAYTRRIESQTSGKS